MSAFCFGTFLPSLVETVALCYAFIQNFYKETIDLEEIDKEFSNIPWIASILQSYHVDVDEIEDA